MSIESRPYYWVRCDECGVDVDYDEFGALAEPQDAIDAAVNQHGWTVKDFGFRHYCPKCAVPT